MEIGKYFIDLGLRQVKYKMKLVMIAGISLGVGLSFLAVGLIQHFTSIRFGI